jgi:hypothetical protein
MKKKTNNKVSSTKSKQLWKFDYKGEPIPSVNLEVQPRTPIETGDLAKKLARKNKEKYK